MKNASDLKRELDRINGRGYKSYKDLEGQYKFNNYSRGFIYGNRRPTDIQTEGMIIRQALKQVNHDGDCLYTVFPYQGKYKVMKKTIEEKEEEYMKAAAPYKILNYFRLYNEREIKDIGKSILLYNKM